MSLEVLPDVPHETQEWQILDVREGKVVPNQKGPGNLQSFYCTMEGKDDGWTSPDRVWWRRREGNVPKVGDTLHGTVSVGKFGYGFKLSQDAPQTPSGPRQPDFKAAAGSPTGETQDARQRSIIRQHSQEMALRFLATCYGSTEPQTKLEGTPEWLELHLSPIVDWFESDASGQARPSAPSGAPSDLDVPFRTPIYPDPFSGPEKGARGL